MFIYVTHHRHSKYARLPQLASAGGTKPIGARPKSATELRT